jgi:hypothetical protein
MVLHLLCRLHAMTCSGMYLNGGLHFDVFCFVLFHHTKVGNACSSGYGITHLAFPNYKSYYYTTLHPHINPSLVRIDAQNASLMDRKNECCKLNIEKN